MTYIYKWTEEPLYRRKPNFEHLTSNEYRTPVSRPALAAADAATVDMIVLRRERFLQLSAKHQTDRPSPTIFDCGVCLFVCRRLSRMRIFRTVLVRAEFKRRAGNVAERHRECSEVSDKTDDNHPLPEASHVLSYAVPRTRSPPTNLTG